MVRAASAQITKTIGKAAGGRRGGRSPSAPPGGPGGPHGAGPMGGARVFSTVDPGGGGGSPETLGVAQTRQESQQSTKQQSSDMRHSISSQKTGTASDVSQGAGRFAEHAEVQATQQIGVNSAVSDRTSQPGQSSYGSFRKTAVKPGERRAASRINTVAGMTSRAAATESFNTTAHDRQRTDSTSSQNAAQKSANVLAAPFSLSGTHEHGSNQVTPQQTKGGAVVNTIQTTARDHTSVNKIHTDHQKPMDGELSHSRTPGGMRGKGGSAMESGNGEPHMVRSTRRSRASEREVEYRSRLSAVSSSGTAGTGGATSASQSSARETRHSRNAPPPPATATPPVKPARSSSVRQEPHKVAERWTAPIGGGAPPAAPGIAGTAPAGQRTSQTRQTAKRQAARENSTPVAADTHGARRAAIISSVQEKKAAPRNVAPKPPKKDGGTGRG